MGKEEVQLDLWYCHVCNSEVYTFPDWPLLRCPMCLDTHIQKVNLYAQEEEEEQRGVS